MFHDSYLVVIEGGDKLGKATQAKLLEQNLIAAKVPAVVEEVPYNDKGITYDLIYKMLFNGEAVRHPRIFQTLQACNRRVFQGTYLGNLTSHFKVIVLDRWTPSTWVYGRASGLTPEEDRVAQQGLAQPDLVFVFDGDAFPTPGKEDDEYEKNTEFQKTVRGLYREYVEEHENALLIDANRDRQVIAAELMEHVLKLVRR